LRKCCWLSKKNPAVGRIWPYSSGGGYSCCWFSCWKPTWLEIGIARTFFFGYFPARNLRETALVFPEPYSLAVFQHLQADTYSASPNALVERLGGGTSTNLEIMITFEMR
jgi:hypothetical protein